MTFFAGLDFDDALRVYLRENDLVLLSAQSVRAMCRGLGLEVIDDSDRTAWVVSNSTEATLDSPTPQTTLEHSCAQPAATHSPPSPPSDYS